MLIIIEGFDHQDTATPVADMEEKWNDTDSTGFTIESVSPQGAGRSITLDAGSEKAVLGEISNIYLERDASYAKGLIGFHMRTATMSDYNTPFFRLVQNDPSNVTQMELRFDVDGSLIWCRGTTEIYRSRGWRYNNIYADGAWIHFEIKYHISNACDPDSCIVRVNGQPILKLPNNTDTQPSTNDTVNGFEFIGGSADRDIDNLYWASLTGVGVTDFINTNGGGIYVQTMTPSGDATAQWTPYPNAGEDNYEDVDDIPDDGDTTYCVTTTTDNQNTFNYGKPQQYAGFYLDVETTDDMHGVQLTSRVRGEAGEEAHFYHVMEKSGNTWVCEPTNTGHLSTSYKYYISTVSVDPSTGSDWTRASIDSYDFGVKRGDYPG